LVSAVETVYRNQTAVVSPAVGAAGTITDASNSINEFGRYDAKSVERTASAMAGSPATAGGPLVTEVETVYRNQASVVSPSAGAAGTINDASNSINEFALYDAKKVVRTATPADSTWVSYPDYVGTNYVRNFRNQTTVPVDGMTAATNNSLSFGTNEFGRYDGTAVRAAVAGGLTWTPTGEEWSFSYKNRQGETIKVFEKICTSKAIMTAWITTASDAAMSIIGEDSGNRTEMNPYRSGWHGKRVEIGTLMV
jgi:hypothetical protein